MISDMFSYERNINRFMYQWLIIPHTQNGVRLTDKHVHICILFSYPMINTDFGQKYQIKHYCPYVTTLSLVYISTFYSNTVVNIVYFVSKQSIYEFHIIMVYYLQLSSFQVLLGGI